MKVLDKIKSFFSATFSSQDDAILMLNITNPLLAPFIIGNRKIEIAETSNLDELEDLAQEFMMNIFELNLNECLVTDESTLSDFSTCNISDMHGNDISYQDLIKLGDDFTIHLIDVIYNIDVKITDKIIDVLNNIKENDFPQ